MWLWKRDDPPPERLGLAVPRGDYETAVQRIVEQAHEGDEFPAVTWDGPTAGPGPYGPRR